MSRYVNEQKIKQRSLLEPQTRLLGANIIKPPPLAVVILLLPFYAPAGASFSATSAVLAFEISSVSLMSASLTIFSCSRL